LQLCFKRSCVAHAQCRDDEPCKLVTRFDVIQQV